MDYVSVDQNENSETTMGTMSLDTVGILEDGRSQQTEIINKVKTKIKRKAKQGRSELLRIKQSINDKYSLSSNKSSLIVQMITYSPRDAKNFVYISLILSGVGYLFPINCLINAANFYLPYVCHNNPIYAITLAYILVSVATVAINNCFVRTVHFSRRITYGYLLSIFVFTLLTVFVNWYRLVSKAITYHLLILAASLMAVGCSVQQTSYYGYSSLLPRRYSQALMIGESVSGVLASTLRLLTYLFMDHNTEVFFSLTVIILIICLACFLLSQRTAFVRHYLQRNTTSLSSSMNDRPPSLCYSTNEDFFLSNPSSHVSSYAPSLTSSTTSSCGLYLHNNVRAPSHPTFQYHPESYRSTSLNRISLNTSNNTTTKLNHPHHKSYSMSGPNNLMQSSFTNTPHYQYANTISDTITHHNDEPPKVESSEDEEMEDFYNVAGQQHEDYENDDREEDEGPSITMNSREDHRTKAESSVNLTAPTHSRPRLIMGSVLDKFTVDNLYVPIKQKLSLMRSIWQYMLVICLTYFVTLCVFPGIAMGINSKSWSHTFPLIVLFTFNIFDLIGKLLTTVSASPGSFKLLIGSMVRLVMIPLILMCALPVNNPIIKGGASNFWPLLFIALLGITNGYFGCMPMLLAPSCVSESDRELAGNLMTTAYNIGLSIGVITAQRTKLAYLSYPPINITNMTNLNITHLSIPYC